MSSTGVKHAQTADLGCVQRAQVVPLLGHPCFWVEVIAILNTETEPITQALSVVLPKTLLRYREKNIKCM